MGQTTSQYLKDQLHFPDEELRAEELAEYTADREALLKSVEEFYDNKKPTMFTIFTVLRKVPGKLPAQLVKEIEDSAAWSLDDCFCRVMVSEIPRVVSRALLLEPLLMQRTSQADENPYIREATRCYLLGLCNASVALSRGALELAFDKKIPVLLRGKSREDRLHAQMSTARVSILKHAPEIADLADKVRKRANVIVHGKKACKESEALEILQDTRKIIHFLYRQKP